MQEAAAQARHTCAIHRPRTIGHLAAGPGRRGGALGQCSRRGRVRPALGLEAETLSLFPCEHI